MRSALVFPALLLVALAAAPAQEAGRGRAIAENGTNDVAACAACHGPDGQSNGNDQFPRLAGLQAAYLQKQLEDYASGARRNEIMTPIAQSLRQQERRDLAAWYASLPGGGPAPGASASEEERQRGARVFNLGDAGRGLQACVNCHGANGAGLGPLNPSLAGQWPAYARGQFEAWRQGGRANDVAGVMREIAGRISDADLAAVSAWLAQQGR